MSLIFLSHIHEEKELAIIIQNAIENEFSGFVDVFVSSDGKTITPGANFLKRIEDGLVNCAAAIYLISPQSVKRNWINFELGAVWIRNVLNLQSGGKEIPAIPVCHSNLTPSTLPMPLTNLNAISANNAAQLELVFKSIQMAVGGKGNLKTDFDNLAKLIYEFEQEYTVLDSLKKIFEALGLVKDDLKKLIDHCKLQQGNNRTDIELGFRNTDTLDLIRNIEQNKLSKYISLQTTNPGTQFLTTGAQNGANAVLSIDPKIVIKFENKII